MKYIKYVAILLILAVLVSAGVGIYAYINTRLQVVSISVSTRSAESDANTFSLLQSRLDNGSSTAAVYTTALDGSASDYGFFTYCVRLHNNGLIRAEMVEVQPYPVNGDALSYTTLDTAQLNANRILEAGEDIELYCTLLTSAANLQNYLTSRTFRITYYIWGMPMTVEATCQ